MSHVRAFVLAATVGFAALLAGCQHQSGDASATLTPAREGSTPEHRLKFSDDGVNAKLVAGANDAPPEFMLECDHGAGEVHLTRRGGGRTRRLVLSSGGARSELAVSAEAFEGGRWLFARAPASSEALSAFRDSGRLVVGGDHPGDTYTAIGDPSVKLFFAACAQTA